MNKLAKILLLIAAIFIAESYLIGCKKAPNKIDSQTTKEYQLTVTITGNGNYIYQLGQYKECGRCKDLKVINRYATDGDYFESSAIADSSNSTICIESNRGTSDSKECVYGIYKIGVSYQF